MEQFKQYIAKQLIGKRLHFKCDCIFPIDKIGTVVDYEIISNEIIFIIDVGGKVIKLGENHPNLYVNRP
jgi:hypothetical protein